MTVFVVDDDEIMARCIARAITPALGMDASVQIFGNALSAMEAIAKGELPSLIFLDVLLDGPDGFTFLNELVSYPDTAKIHVVLVTSLSIEASDLSEYGVVGQLSKETMTPQEIRAYVEAYA